MSTGQEINDSMRIISTLSSKGGTKMETTMKTKDVSRILGVDPTTVQRWVKHFKIKALTNEQGHYVFKEEDVKVLKEIKQQLNAGKRMKDVRLYGSRFEHVEKRSENEQVPVWKHYEKIDSLFERVLMLENKLEGKADGVVTYQLLKHRSELNEMNEIIEKMKAKLEDVEQRLKNAQEKNDVTETTGHPRKRRQPLAKLFSL